MKKRQRIRALEDLLSQLESNNFDKREYALFQFGLMLDRSNLTEADELAARTLSRKHLRLRLATDEQELVAERLSRLALRSHASRASAIWTLGKVEADVLLDPLLALMESLGAQLSDEAAYQACSALSKCLDKSDTVAAPIRARLRDAKLNTVLGRWRDSDAKSLQKTASAVIALIEQLDG